MKRYLMKCGHRDNAQTGDHKPCCVLCIGNPNAFIVDREIINDTDGLEGRHATCEMCGRKVDSKWTLPFFEYRPNKVDDVYYCGCGGWD